MLRVTGSHEVIRTKFCDRLATRLRAGLSLSSITLGQTNIFQYDPCGVYQNQIEDCEPSSFLSFPFPFLTPFFLPLLCKTGTCSDNVQYIDWLLKSRVMSVPGVTSFGDS